jgi:hypothetical protein
MDQLWSLILHNWHNSGQSELATTNALVGHFVHWTGCVFSFSARWGSS